MTFEPPHICFPMPIFLLWHVIAIIKPVVILIKQYLASAFLSLTYSEPKLARLVQTALLFYELGQ